MVKLTDVERRELDILFKSPWFKVLKKIADDFEINVLRKFKTVNMADPIAINILSKNTYYLRGVEDFLLTAETGVNKLAERKFDDDEAKE